MPEPDATPRVALVIPTLNGEPLFEQVLEMWRAQTGVGELEICCPDSGSSDGTRDTIRRAGGRLLEIPPAEFNHGETRNRGLAMTQREFVILSVQDALPLSPTTAAELVAPLMDDERVSATFGRQVPRAGCHPVLAARIDSWAGGTELVVHSLDGRDWEQLEPLERLGLIRYDHVIACVRRAAWEQQPLAVASFGEDVEWSSRVIRAGGRIAFVPGAEVQHSHDRSAWDEARRIYCDHRNLRRLVGLVTVPNRRQIAVNVQAARAHYRNLVDAQQGVDSTTRENWQRWADKLALYENWAQYLGAHFGRSPWFRPVDRWLRRGI